MELYQISVTVWIPMQLTTFICLILIQLTTLFGGLNRGRVWHGFMVSWATFCFSHCLLYISGQQPTQEQSEPRNHVVCMAQAALVSSANTLVCMTMLSLFLELYWRVGSARLPQRRMTFQRRAGSPWLLIVPYGVWCLLIITYVAFGIIHPSEVIFSGVLPYCGLENNVLGLLNSISSSVAFVASMIVLVRIAGFLLKSEDENSPYSQSLKQYTGLFIRFAIIWIAGVVGLVVIIMWDVKHIPPIFYLFAARAGGPLLAVILFGSQKDIWLTWGVFAHGSLEKLKNMVISRPRGSIGTMILASEESRC